MTKRGATSAVQTEIAKDANQPFHLLEIYLDSGTIYMTDGFAELTWGGNTYPALGYLLDFAGIEESSDMKVSQVTVSLSAVDQTLIAEFLSYDYIDRRLVIRKALYDADMAVIVDPFPIFDGRIDQPTVSENPDDGTSVVALTASSAFINFERKAGRHTNHAEQQVFFPGDLAFEFVGQLNKDIRWGSSSPAPASGSVASAVKSATGGG